MFNNLDLFDKFNSKIKIVDSCWIWQMKPDMDGYGRIMIDRCNYKAHRLSWMIKHRKEIPDGMCILHNCPGGDNRLCVNPDHLWLGTDIDNMKDRKKKRGYPRGSNHPLKINPSRAARGEQAGNSHLKNNDILKIRELYAMGNYSQPQLAKMFSCVHSTIGVIVNRKIWKHI